MWRLLKWFGRIGGWIDATVSVAFNWQVIVSATVGIGAGAWAWWNWATQWGYLPVALVGLLVFVAVIWLWNGIIWLKHQKRPSKQRTLFDYSYGLDISNVYLGRDKKDETIQIGVVLKNTASGPVQFYVEDMDVIIENRTLTQPEFKKREGVIPIISERVFFYPPMPQDYFKDRSRGMLKITIKYGHPELGYLRRIKRKLDLSVRVDEKLSCVYLIEEESDAPI